jgi:hypothetical protein
VAPKLIPVFINDKAIEALPGSALSQVLADHDPQLLAILLDPSGAVMDARGLPVNPDAPIHAGAIYRIRRSARREGGVDV